MKAVLISKPTKAEDIVLSEVPVPAVQPGWVLVKIRAFGLNHSEQILREYEIERDYIQKPVIPGIECVGEIADSSDSDFRTGQKVAALMGGMGRSFNGSYAEYALLPFHHVFSVETSLDWTEMAAVPETYYTAWGSIFQNLQLKKDDKILIRGGTCALGYVAVQLAKAYGCEVAATTHRKEKFHLLEEAGVDECILDKGDFSDGSLSEKVSGVTKILELIGGKTIVDSLQCLSSGGICCHTGVLGGDFGISDFYPIQQIPNGAYLTGFHSNWPTQKVISDIFSFLENHNLKPLVGAVYKFENIRDALLDLDSHRTNGKIVITL